MTSTHPPAEGDDAVLAPFPSAEEVALGRELARLDSCEREQWEHEEGPRVGAEPASDAELLDAASAQASASDLWLLDSIDPLDLGDQGAILDYLRISERIDAFNAALKARARVALAGAKSTCVLMSELHVEQELAIATRSSHYVAGMNIERARVLTTTFPTFLAALREGRISEAHCRTLVEKTRPVTDAVALAAIERVLLPKAARMTPGKFAREVAKAIADFDPDAATRIARAHAQRSVWTRELEDGLSFLGLVHDTTTITAIKATLDTDAVALRALRRTPADAVLEADAETGASDVWASTDPAVLDAAIDDATGVLIGACRADALAARVLGTTDETGAIDWTQKPADVQVHLVMDLPTLRGEADRHCLLDGQPVPASVGRELAGCATAFRRMVTDPVDGHLLDYGRLTYLPAPLRAYTLARDGGCRAPGCTAADPRRMQMDHATPFPIGASDAANTGGACLAHHQLKTSGFLHIEGSAADGSCDWVTGWGQRVHIPARPFLHDPADDPPDDPDPPLPLEEPPF